MSDLLTTLANLDANSDKRKITDAIRQEVGKLLKNVDIELKLSKELHIAGKKKEADELLDLVGKNLEVIKRLRQLNSDIMQRLR
jgi:ABC-type hemin transport system substrate-binding protein